MDDAQDMAQAIADRAMACESFYPNHTEVMVEGRWVRSAAVMLHWIRTGELL